MYVTVFDGPNIGVLFTVLVSVRVYVFFFAILNSPSDDVGLLAALPGAAAGAPATAATLAAAAIIATARTAGTAFATA